MKSEKSKAKTRKFCVQIRIDLPRSRRVDKLTKKRLCEWLQAQLSEHKINPLLNEDGKDLVPHVAVLRTTLNELSASAKAFNEKEI